MAFCYNSPMGTLILIRHGETNKNLNNSLHVRNDVESLNETGKKQMEETAEKLKELSPERIYSSTEKRAVESAQILSRVLNIPMEKIDGMQEWNLGVFTGKSRDEIKNILEPMTMEEKYVYVPKGGESWKTFETRLIAVVKKIVEANKDKTVAVVTHGGAIKALMPFLLKLPKEGSFNYKVNNGSMAIFNFNDIGFEQVPANDTSRF